MPTRLRRFDAWNVAVAIGMLATMTALFRVWWRPAHPTTVVLAFLLVVLIVATTSRVWAAMIIAVLADLCLNYFFMPPYGTFSIADPDDWVTLIVFLAVSFIAGSLSAAARDRALARQSEELKSALLASLGHNLRTPLTAIRVAAGNVQAGRLTDDDRRDQTDVILTEVDRLNRLFANVLDLAGVEAGAIRAETQWTSPQAIYEAACEQVEPALRGRHVRVSGAAGHLVRLDPRLTASALAQVLENAAQYSPPAAPIEVSLGVSAAGLTIGVRDHGPGLPAADLPHVFDRFYRGHAAAIRPAGTGMGLSIARGLLAAEHGTIRADNAPAGGAVFMLAIPADHRPADFTDLED